MNAAAITPSAPTECTWEYPSE
jgi:hypothetical protein